MSTKLIDGRESLNCYASGAPFQLNFCWMRPPDNTDERRRHGNDARIASSRKVTIDDVKEWIDLNGNTKYKEEYHIIGPTEALPHRPVRLVRKLKYRTRVPFKLIREAPKGPSFYRAGDVEGDLIYELEDRWYKNADGTASKFGKNETLKHVKIKDNEKVYLWH